MWYVEKGTGNEWSDINGYHNINHVIVQETQDVSGYAIIEEFLNSNTLDISPLVVAKDLETNANAALAGIAEMPDDGNIELGETLGDIKSQAFFGLYWAPKIRGGCELSSNSGLRLLRQVEQKLGIIKRIVKILPDNRHVSYIDNELWHMLSQPVFQIAAGYEDGNDCDSLRHDPILKTVCDKKPQTDDPLAGQPTMSSFENSLSSKDLYRIGDEIYLLILHDSQENTGQFRCIFFEITFYE